MEDKNIMTTFENANKEQVEEFVKKFIIDEGYPLEPHPDPNSSFNYKITKENLQLNIGQHKESEDNIMIVGAIVFNPQEQNMLRYLKTKRELLYELEIVFTLTNISFGFKPNMTKDEFTMEDIRLSKVIYYDALTKQVFYDGLNSIMNCLKLIIMKFTLLGRSETTT